MSMLHKGAFLTKCQLFCRRRHSQDRASNMSQMVRGFAGWLCEGSLSTTIPREMRANNFFPGCWREAGKKIA